MTYHFNMKKISWTEVILFVIDLVFAFAMTVFISWLDGFNKQQSVQFLFIVLILFRMTNFKTQNPQ